MRLYNRDNFLFGFKFKSLFNSFRPGIFSSGVVLFGFLFALAAPPVKSQNLSSLRQKNIMLLTDTTRLDTLSIAPGTFYLRDREGSIIDTARYRLLPGRSLLIWKSDFPTDTLRANYRVMAIDLSRPYRHRSLGLIQPEADYSLNPFTFQPGSRDTESFSNSELVKTGSISRGIGFGNNQDLTVNSSLSLQLNGKLTENINVLASVTDDNIPIQPEGNTAQLQEFDQVYIQLYNDNSKLTVGDFMLENPVGWFTRYFKRAQGVSFATDLPFKKSEPLHFFTETSAALSRGKYARNRIQGGEGNQGPYRLTGNAGESFIVVLAGTEKVFIDGRQMLRGQENDYVINYNTAEITFTPSQPITKDKRIVVEFQYTSSSYVRSMFQTSTGVKNEKVTAYLNFYSEQDVKNQPLQQDLSSNDKQILSEVGDDVLQAVAPAYRPVDEFSNSQIFYTVHDTLGYDSVFVYTPVDSPGLYAVSFSNVGPGNGDYIASGFQATGRIYAWVAPDTVNGVLVRQGSYAPVRLLIAPKKEQMLMAGVTWSISDHTTAMAEAGFSNNDINTFSDKDSGDNYSHGIRTALEHKQPLGNDPNPVFLKGKVAFESTGNNFQPIEPYRDVEFNRNWNLDPLFETKAQNLESASLGLEKEDVFHAVYSINRFQTGNEYTGLRNELTSGVDVEGFRLKFDGSALETKGVQKTRFLRHTSTVEKKIWLTVLGFHDEREENKRFQASTDSLSASAYKFYDWQFYLTNPDSANLGYKLFYRERKDYGNQSNLLIPGTHATEYGASFSLLKNPANQLKAMVSQRELRILNNDLTDQSPENTLLGRIDHTLRLAKNAVVSTIYYEIGSGLERRQEFVYIADPTGQGPYTWIDYNKNNIKELNEFELARPEDGDRYIRIFTPTDSYERAYTNQYTQTLNLSPAGMWNGKSGIVGVLAHFSNQTAFRIQRKTRYEDDAGRFNPFRYNFQDSALISQQSSIRNTVFFNRTSSKFGVDYTYTDQFGKNPLTTGFEERKSKADALRIRYNFNPKFGIVLDEEKGVQASASDVIDGRNYAIDYFTLKQTFTYQPGTQFKVSLINAYTRKENDADLGGETAEIIDLGADFRLSKPEAGIVFARFNYISIDYSGQGNNSLAYQMLDGLQSGKNFTWAAGIQRSLGKNLQLNLSYNGRKSEEVKAVHTGTMEVRAYF